MPLMCAVLPIADPEPCKLYVNNTMSIQSLLVINPDKLFEENGIDRIKTVQFQMQNEIEKKREELRTMVG